MRKLPFLKLTGYERAERILVNTAHISHVRDNTPDGSEVYMGSGWTILVKEVFSDPPTMASVFNPTFPGEIVE